MYVCVGIYVRLCMCVYVYSLFGRVLEFSFMWSVGYFGNLGVGSGG